MAVLRIAVAAAVAVGLASVAWADQAALRVSADTDRRVIAVGDTFRLNLDLEWTEGVQVRPLAVGDRIGGFTVRDLNYGTVRPLDGGFGRRISLLLTVFELGRQSIPPITILYTAEEGTPLSLETSPVEIDVESILPDSLAGASPPGAQVSPASLAPLLRDIKKPLVVPRKWKDLIQSYALLVGLAVGTAASILLSVRRREEIEALLRRIWLRVTLPVKRLLAWLLVRLGLLRRQEEAAFDIRVREPDLIPEEAAFKELDRIDALGLVGRGMIKDHYSLVSETVRRYLERKFGVLAMESPTSLTLAALGELEIGDQGYNLTVEVLDEADLVKFAKFRPDGSRVDSLLERARSLVRLTGSVPVSTNMGAY